MRNVVWSILLLTLLCGVASAATLSVEPAECTCAHRGTVDLTVQVQDVSNLGGFDIDVTWDSSVVVLDPEPGNVTIGPLFSGHANHSAVYPQSSRVRVAAVNATLEGVSGSADLFTVRLKADDDTGASTLVSIKVNNYGFLNSTSGEDITVSSVTGATITTKRSNEVKARIAAASSRVIVGQPNQIIASVVNSRGVETSSLDIVISIFNETGDQVGPLNHPKETIPAWGKFQRDVTWIPDKSGTYTVTINVTSDEPLIGKETNATKVITAEEYKLEFISDTISGPGDNRTSTDTWFNMGAHVKASRSGNAWLNITAPDHVVVEGGRNQTRYLYAGDLNYVNVRMRSDTPGRIDEGDIRFSIAAYGVDKSLNGPEILIWIPSIRVSSVGTTLIRGDGGIATLIFNTLHTNHTYDNVTKIVIQSGARGRTLSGLEYLVDYPYGCVESTASKMLASLNVKNYYSGSDKPKNWTDIEESADKSIEAGIKKLLKGGEIGQNDDGGWSLWGYGSSESPSSSHAGYSLAKINDSSATADFEKLIEWFHECPDTDKWEPHPCHSWTRESNTAFVMLVHDMINQTVDVQAPYLGYMEDNMKVATRHLVESIGDGSLFSGQDPAMTAGLALWGLEAFAIPSEGVGEGEIEDAKEAVKVWLIAGQDDGGSWPAHTYYGWYDLGRTTEATAYAVLALNATGIPAENETIRGGVDWLIGQYEKGGGWGYTWASQAAIDALIQCQLDASTGGTVTVKIDDEPIGSFAVSASDPWVEHLLTDEQMNTLMAGGIPGTERPFIRSHMLTATLSGNGPILVSVDHSQFAPIKEVDGTIKESRLIRSFGCEEEAGPLQVSTDIGILSDSQTGDEGSRYSIDIDSTQMVAGEEAKVTIVAEFKGTEVKGVHAPMIEIPIAGFTYVDKSLTENDIPSAYDILNGTTSEEHSSLVIHSNGWVRGEAMTYTFNITPKDHGALDLDLRIRPLCDDTDVTFANKTFTVMGRGDVTVNVVDENGADVIAKSIALTGEGGVPIDLMENVQTHTFAGVLEGAYQLVVNGTNDYPSIRTAVKVKPDATAPCNVTLPQSLTDPTLIFSEGGAGSIASVEWERPGRLSAAYAENTTYTVTVLGDGGEVGIALEFPMRYLMNKPAVRVNGAEAKYELINGTFTYDVKERTYSTTNATLIVYNTTAGSNMIEIEFEGGLLGDAFWDGIIDPMDALMILHFYVGNIDGFENFDYPFVFNRAEQKIDPVDALMVLHRYVGNVDEYYQ